MGILSKWFATKETKPTYTSEQTGRNFKAVANEFRGDIVQCEGCGCLMHFEILDVHDCRPDNPNVWEDDRDYEGDK